MYDCKHIEDIKSDPAPKTPEGCEECLVKKQSWVELRKCLTCGHVGCCDNSFGKHATAHFQETGHPVMEGYKTKLEFWWCYADELPV